MRRGTVMIGVTIIHLNDEFQNSCSPITTNIIVIHLNDEVQVMWRNIDVVTIYFPMISGALKVTNTVILRENIMKNREPTLHAV